MGVTDSKIANSYTLKETVWADGDSSSLFSLYKASSKTSNAPASVFIFNRLGNNDDELLMTAVK
ncbi:hypothetical protein HK096_009281, partial [Nowakowskiella sp. JEL0078]